MTRIFPEYNTQAVTKRTGIPAATFLSWERRYGVPQPIRDDRGQRRYSESDIRQIEWIRDQVARGLRVSDIVAALDQHVSTQTDAEKAPVPTATATATATDVIVSLAADRQASPAPLPIPHPKEDPPGFIEQLILSLRNLDDVGVNRLLATKAAVTSAVETVSRTVPILIHHLREAVATDAERGVTLRFAEEVFARKLGTLLDVVNPEMSSRVSIVAAVSESTPRVDLLLVALVYANTGVRTIVLGTGISLPDLLSSTESHPTSDIVLVASTNEDARVAQAYRDHIRLVVSGWREREIVIHRTPAPDDGVSVNPASSSPARASNASSPDVSSLIDPIRSS